MPLCCDGEVEDRAIDTATACKWSFGWWNQPTMFDVKKFQKPVSSLKFRLWIACACSWWTMCAALCGAKHCRRRRCRDTKSLGDRPNYLGNAKHTRTSRFIRFLRLFFPIQTQIELLLLRPGMKWSGTKYQLRPSNCFFFHFFSTIENVFHWSHDEKKQIGDFIDHIRNGPKYGIRLDERRAAVQLNLSLQGLLCDGRVSRLTRLPSIWIPFEFH